MMSPVRSKVRMRKIYLALLSLTIFDCAMLQKNYLSCGKNSDVCVVSKWAGYDGFIYGVNNRNFPISMHIDVKCENCFKYGDTISDYVIGPKKSILLKKVSVRELAENARVSVNYHWMNGSFLSFPDSGYIYSLPFEVGRHYVLVQGYNGKVTHTGPVKYSLDFGLPLSSPICAAREGIVIETENSNDTACFEKECEKYANYINILHNDGTIADYAHLKKNGVLVSVGDSVSKGQIIGYSGNTGRSQGPHLHFMVMQVVGTDKFITIPTKFKTTEGVFGSLKEGISYIGK